MDSFQNKLAVVTGGGSGMGRELVLQLAAEGCSVAACDLNLEAAAETAALATDGAPDGVRVTAHACDVSDEAAVNAFRDEVLAQHDTDHVNLLFNNAGIAGAGSFLADDRAAWERVFNVCWNGVYYCTRAFMPLLVASDDGYIVNTSSANGFWATHGPGAPSTAYATAKFAVKGFSEALIEDLRANAPHVKVTLVMPGTIGTRVGTNSARALAGDDEAEALRGVLGGFGFPVGDASVEEVLALADVIDTTTLEFAPTTAVSAAETILEAVKAGRWRVLLGADAAALDAAVRADPERAYDPDFVGLGPDWTFPMIMLLTQFDSGVDPGFEGNFELRFGDVRNAVRVAGGSIEATSGAPEGQPEATVTVHPDALCAVLGGETTLAEAEARGELELAGDRAQFERLLAATAAKEGKA